VTTVNRHELHVIIEKLKNLTEDKNSADEQSITKNSLSVALLMSNVLGLQLNEPPQTYNTCE